MHVLEGNGGVWMDNVLHTVNIETVRVREADVLAERYLDGEDASGGGA